MLPLLALGLGSAGASLLGGLMNRGQDIDWGAVGSRYMNQFGDAYRNQYMRAYMGLSPLTMGAENAPDYANSALGQFQRSSAYQTLLGQAANQANANSQAAQSNASQGANFGVGNAAFNLGNPGALMNSLMGQALLQQYLQGQQQFGQLAGLRLGGAGDIAGGAGRLASQAMGQYTQQPNMMQRLGGGLQGLGSAGLNIAMMGGLGGGGGAGRGAQMINNYQTRNPAWDVMPDLPGLRGGGPGYRPMPPVGPMSPLGPMQPYGPVWRG